MIEFMRELIDDAEGAATPEPKGQAVLMENSGVTRIWKNCERSTSVLTLPKPRGHVPPGEIGELKERQNLGKETGSADHLRSPLMLGCGFNFTRILIKEEIFFSHFQNLIWTLVFSTCRIMIEALTNVSLFIFGAATQTGERYLLGEDVDMPIFYAFACLAIVILMVSYIRKVKQDKRGRKRRRDVEPLP